MKKKITLCVLTIFFTSVLSAQRMYQEKQWYVGPTGSLGFQIKNLQGDNRLSHFDQIGFLYNAGVFVGYSFTDLIGVQIEAIFGGNILNEKSNAIKIPAMFMLQFSEHRHFGIGAMYNISTKEPKYNGSFDFGRIDYSSSNSSHLSVFVEYSSLLFHTWSDLFFTYVDFNNLTQTRSFIRIGLGVTPGNFTLGDNNQKYLFKPFFFEYGFRYDFMSIFDNKSNSKAKNKGRRKY